MLTDYQLKLGSFRIQKASYTEQNYKF